MDALLVGEWSCALPPESLGGRKGFELDLAVRAYGSAQLINFDETQGWFFWTYTTEEGGAWSFRDCVRRGWLPERYAV
jgi:glucan 1,3-beta-glucosidase